MTLDPKLTNRAFFLQFQGKAKGRHLSVYIRHIFQSHLYRLGCSISKHAGKIIFIALLALCSCYLGFKSAIIHSNVNELWIEVGGRLENELSYTEKAIGEKGTATNNQMLIQTLRHTKNSSNILHTQALLTHLDIVKCAISVQVLLDDITWSIKDICQSPTTPNFDEHFIEQIFESVFPCIIITPLDCFWEGSKLLGPDHPVRIP